MSVETRQIRFLLDSGEWGELSNEIEGLKDKAEAILEAEDAFSALFEQLERKREVVFKNYFLKQNTGLCQTHRSYSRWITDEYFFPLDQLQLVDVKIIRPHPGLYPFKKVVCNECLPRFLRELGYPDLHKHTVSIPDPQEFWEAAKEDDVRRLARHLKMPSLRDYTEVFEDANKRRKSA